MTNAPRQTDLDASPSKKDSVFARFFRKKDTLDLSSDDVGFEKKPVQFDLQFDDDVQDKNQTSYLVSWLFFFLAGFVLLIGCYAAYQTILAKPKANVMLLNKNLSNKRELQVRDQLNNAVQGNFFTADLHHIKDEVSNLDWVQTVQVSRQWPNGIAINVLPRHAVALFGSERFVSSDGSVFSGEDLRTLNIDELPLLYGPKDKSKHLMQQYFQINQWFESAGIRLKELSVTEQKTWFLKFDDGLRVIVDKENNQKKLFQLSQLLTKQLKPVRNRIEAIDLRYRNGLALSWKNGKPDNLKYIIK